jgi:hypothetical protein
VSLFRRGLNFMTALTVAASFFPLNVKPRKELSCTRTTLFLPVFTFTFNFSRYRVTLAITLTPALCDFTRMILSSA